MATEFIFRFEGLLHDDVSAAPFLLSISAPEEDEIGGDAFCRVRAPQMLCGDKIIYGIDFEQAVALARSFAIRMVPCSKVTDALGNVVDLKAMISSTF